MNKQISLNELIAQKNWAEIVKNFETEEVAKRLPFKTAMLLAYNLFIQNQFEADIEDFAVRLFLKIKKVHYQKWETDWKNDIFLGRICEHTWREDEMYQAYKDAYHKFSDPPEVVLLAMASCRHVPGSPYISKEEEEQFLKNAVEKKPSCEAILSLKYFYKDLGDIQQQQYWAKRYEEAQKQGIHTESIHPDIFK